MVLTSSVEFHLLSDNHLVIVLLGFSNVIVDMVTLREYFCDDVFGGLDKHIYIGIHHRFR